MAINTLNCHQQISVYFLNKNIPSTCLSTVEKYFLLNGSKADIQ